MQLRLKFWAGQSKEKFKKEKKKKERERGRNKSSTINKWIIHLLVSDTIQTIRIEPLWEHFPPEAGMGYSFH